MIVDLLPTEDQAMIADSVSALFADRLPVVRLGDAAAHGGRAEAALWSEIAALGLIGLGVAEADGGVGYTIAEEVIVAHAAGRHLVSPGLIATMVAAHLGDAARYMTGERRVAFANPLRGPGERVHLIDADGADELLLCTERGSRLVPARDVIGEPVDAIDETLSFARAQIEPSEDDGPGDAVFQRCELLLAAYLAGVSAAALAMAVDYAKVREQFGQPIGAFQAIKHACADMALRTEGAYSQTCYAAALAGTGVPDPAAVAAARLLAGRAALENAAGNIQIHGGMGFSEETVAHYYLKRAQVLTNLNASDWTVQRRVLAR